MAQDISLLGAVYSDVPSVLLPKQGGGTAQFDDTTDADATASDILTGKTAYVNGVKITGTGTGGGGSVTQDQDGFIVLPSTGGGGGGGSGLVFEQGTWTPNEDVFRPTINFTDTHTSRPFFVMIADTEETLAETDNSLFWTISSWYDAYGVGIKTTSTAYAYARVQYANKSSSSIGAGGTTVSQLVGDTNATYMGYHLSESWFKPYCGVDTRYWKSTRTYKWIAVWKPTT